MSEADSKSAPTRALPRWSLTLVAGAHAVIFAWAGAELPWSEWSAFAIVCWVLAAAHLATAVAAAARARVLAPIWQGSSLVSLLVLAWLAWQVVRSAAYLAGLYGDLGQGLGAALLAVVGLFALLTLPLSAWGLAATWRPRATRWATGAAGVLLVATGLGAWREASAAAARPLPIPVDDGDLAPAAQLQAQLEDARDRVLPDYRLGLLPRSKGRRSGQAKHALGYTEPVACVPDPAGEHAVAVVTHLAVDAKRVASVSRCVTAPPAELATAIFELVRDEAARGPVKIDVIHAVAPLRSRDRILDMFALQPGLDGVCDDQRCLMPWQLVALELFTANEPLAWVPDFRFGVSPVALRHALGEPVPEAVRTWDREQRNAGRLARLVEKGEATAAPEDAEAWLALDGLTRIETLSFVVEPDGRIHALVRGRERELELTRARLDRALELAERHIAQASQEDGRFRYLLQPYTGKQKSSSWNLPRQAGTTLVVCELGRDAERTKRVAGRSLAFMAEHARSIGDVIALTKSSKAEAAELGSTALPTIAFFSCRDRVGPVHDRTLAGLTRFLLASQREDGSFYPQLDLVSGAPIDGPEPMYAGGQAIFALVLAERLALTEPDAAAAAGLPDAARLRDAVERAMSYYAGPYWDNFARDFFWLEENWHCLAARAALEHHRHPAYEQFCVDYMTYKSRLVLDQDSRVAREFWGGFAFGNVLVPVNTPAAGFGEGLAAAMAIKQARGEDLGPDRARMRQVIEFLVRQQWNETVCFACAPDRPVLGGFSESMSAPEIRIDYTQHAWAALGHGGAWIADELPTGVEG